MGRVVTLFTITMFCCLKSVPLANNEELAFTTDHLAATVERERERETNAVMFMCNK